MCCVFPIHAGLYPDIFSPNVVFATSLLAGVCKDLPLEPGSQCVIVSYRAVCSVSREALNSQHGWSPCFFCSACWPGPSLQPTVFIMWDASELVIMCVQDLQLLCGCLKDDLGRWCKFFPHPEDISP